MYHYLHITSAAILMLYGVKCASYRYSLFHNEINPYASISTTYWFIIPGWYNGRELRQTQKPTSPQNIEACLPIIWLFCKLYFSEFTAIVCRMNDYFLKCSDYPRTETWTCVSKASIIQNAFGVKIPCVQYNKIKSGQFNYIFYRYKRRIYVFERWARLNTMEVQSNEVSYS